MAYSSVQISDILLKADKTMYKLGDVAYENMFDELDEAYDYERDIIFIYKKAVEYGDNYFVGTLKLDQIVERLAAKLNIYDYGTLAPIYVDVYTQVDQGLNIIYVLKTTALDLGPGLTGSTDFSQSQIDIDIDYTYLNNVYVIDERTLTINGVSYDLSANRTWNVGTVTGTGTANYMTKFTSAGVIGDSNMFFSSTASSTNWTIGSTSGAQNNITSLSLAAVTEGRFEANTSDGYHAEFTNSYGNVYILATKTAPNSDNSYILYYNGSSTSNRYLAFQTNGVERLRISHTGDVSIGGTSALAKLDIYGDVNIRTIANAVTDTDKFLVSDGGIVKYRTGAEVLSDIGGASASGFVPYTGATQDVNLGTYGLITDFTRFNTSSSNIPSAEGVMSWNSSDGTVVLSLKGNTYNLPIGESLVARVVNNTGAQLNRTDYKVVRVSSAQGQRLAVQLAQANNDANSADTLGIVCENISNNQEGFIANVGQITEINTTGSLQGETWVDGDSLYLSPTTPGAITNVKPVAPSHGVRLGYVEYAHSQHGKIYVKIDNGYELDELHDVEPTPYVNKGVLYRDTTLNLWKSATIQTLLGYTPANQATTLTINGTTYDLSANRTWSVGTVTGTGTNNYLALWNSSTGLTTSGILQNGTSGYYLDSNSDFGTTFNFRNNATNSMIYTVELVNYSSPKATKHSYTSGIVISEIASSFVSRIFANGNHIIGNGITDNGYKLEVQGTGRFTGALTIDTIANATVDTDKFLVSDGGVVKYRTGAEILSDIGAQAAGSYVPTSRQLTINGTAYDLSADRSWSVGTITSLTGEATGSGTGAVSVTLDNTAVIGKVLTGLNLSGGGTIVSTDSILQAFGKVQNQISALVGGVMYKGVWDANVNSPSLTSSVGNKGDYYIVNVAGSTNLNGITDWRIGDWAIFNGATWDKVDNTDAVSSVNTFTGAVSLTTANIPEVTNLYYLDSRARAALSFTAGSGNYSTSTGVITIPTNTNHLTNGAGFITLTSLSASSPLSYNNLTGGFSIQVANSTQSGYLSSTDWNKFNNNIPAGTPSVGDYVFYNGSNLAYRGIIANSPLSYNSSTATFSISQASGSTNGFLSSTDWTTFNSKQAALNGTGFVKISGTTISYDNSTYYLASNPSSYIAKTDLSAVTPLSYSNVTGVFQMTQANSTTSGYITSTDWNTFNNKQSALTNPVTGTGTTNYLPKFTGSTTIGNSILSESGYTLTQQTANALSVYILKGTSSTTGLWLYTNGVNATLSNQDNGYLSFETNGTERMRITSGGNVGIGTSSPAYTLDVNGTVRATSYFTSDYYRDSRLEAMLIYAGSNQIRLGSGVGADFLTFYGGGSERMRITSDGKVGIGTTSPNVYGVTSARASDSVYYQAQSGSVVAYYGAATAYGTAVAGTFSNHAFSFFTNSSEKMTLDASGRLGIGTTSPTTALNIESVVNANIGNVSITSTNNDASGLSFKVRSSPSDPTNSRSWMIHSNYSEAGTFEILRSTTATGNPTTYALKLNGSTGAATFSSSVTAGSQLSILGSDGGGKKLYFTGGTTKYNFMIAAQENVDNALEITPSTAAGGSTFSTPAITVKSNGNVGLGVTPSAWSGYPAMQILRASFWGAADNSYVGSNYYWDGSTRRYINSNYSTEFAQVSGEFRFYTAPSGTAGNAISFTQAMTLNASGNLSIGNTNDTYKLDVTGTGRFVNNSISTAFGDAATFVLNSTKSTLTGSQSVAILIGKANSLNNQMTLLYNHVSDGSTSNYLGLGFYGQDNLFKLYATGAATFTAQGAAGYGTINLESDDPFIRLYDNGAGSTTDKKKWDIRAIGVTGYESFDIRTVNDANTVFSTKLSIAHSGAATFSSSVTTNAANSFKISSGPYNAVFHNESTSTSDYNAIRVTQGAVGSATGYIGTGGSAVGNTSFQNTFVIGTQSNNALVLNTNDIERLRITSGGNIGIGVTNPGAKLEILGTSSDQLRLATASTEHYRIGRNASTGYLDFYGSQTGYTGYTFGGVDGERMRIISNGSVGINTSSPSQLFTVVSTNNNTSSFSGFYALNGSQGVEMWYGGIRMGGSNTDVDFNLSSKGAANLLFNTNSTERMRITSGGNVGIGTSSPSTLLEIRGAQEGVSGKSLRLSYDGFYYAEYTEKSIRAYNNEFIFGTGSGGAERMRITSGGAVGIATTSPDSGAKLTVAGGILTTSAFSSTTGSSGGVDYYAGAFRLFSIGTSGSTKGAFEFIAKGADNSSNTAMLITSGGEVYIAGTTDQGAYNLQVNGTGVWGAGAYVNGSDIRLKENIKDISSALELVDKLKPKTFNYKESYSKDRSIQTGFIAQDLQEVFANEEYLDGIVQKGPEHLNVAYQNLIPLLTKAIQELKAEIEQLKNK